MMHPVSRAFFEQWDGELASAWPLAARIYAGRFVTRELPDLLTLVEMADREGYIKYLRGPIPETFCAAW